MAYPIDPVPCFHDNLALFQPIRERFPQMLAKALFVQLIHDVKEMADQGSQQFAASGCAKTCSL